MKIYGDSNSGNCHKVRFVANVALLAYTRLAPEGGFDLAPRLNVRGWIRRCEAQLGL